EDAGVSQKLARGLVRSIDERADRDVLVDGHGDVLERRGKREHVLVDDPIRHSREEGLEIQLECTPGAPEERRQQAAEHARSGGRARTHLAWVSAAFPGWRSSWLPRSTLSSRPSAP